MVNNHSIAVHMLLLSILTSLSVDDTLLPSYMNWSANFRDLQFNEMAPSWLKEGVHKHINFLYSYFLIYNMSFSCQEFIQVFLRIITK